MSRLLKALRVSSLGALSLGLLLAGTLGTVTEMDFAWAGYAVCGLAGLLAWGFLGRAGADRAVPARVPTFFMAAFGTYVAVRAAWSPVPYLARADLLLMVAATAVYAVASLGWRHRWSRGILLSTATLLLAGNFVFGLVQWRQNPGLHVLGAWGFERGFRDATELVGGFYILGNHLSGFVEIAALLLLGVAVLGRFPIAVRLLGGFGYVMAAILIALAGARGGVLALGVGTGVLALVGVWYHWPRIRWHSPYLVGGVAAVVLAGASLLVVLHRSFILDQFKDGLGTGGSYRLALNKIALKQVEMEPVFGTGANSFEYIFRGNMPRQWHFVLNTGNPEAEYVHNDYLQLLGDYGWVGFSLGVATILAHLANGLARLVRARRRVGEAGASGAGTESALAMAGIAVVAAYAAHSMVDFNLHIPANALWFAAALAMLNSADPGRGGRRGRQGASGRGWPCVALAVVAGGALAVFAFRYLPAETALMRARIAWNNGRALEAAHHSGVAGARDPLNYTAWLRQGAAHELLAVDDAGTAAGTMWTLEAIASYHKARTAYPQFPYVLARLGELLDDLGATEDAYRAFALALELAPNHGDLWFAYAVHAYNKGDLTAARDAFQRTLDLHLYDERRGPVQRAVKALDEALAERGPSPATPPQGAP